MLRRLLVRMWINWRRVGFMNKPHPILKFCPALPPKPVSPAEGRRALASLMAMAGAVSF